jgi:hypothetical protein
MLRPLVVAALLVLAGCTGLVPDGETRTESPVTAAPVPGVSASDVPVPTRNGTVDRDRLVERHGAALANRSFSRHVQRAGPQNTRDVWVDRERGVVRVRQRFGPLTDDAIVADGTRYRLVSDDPGIDYRTEPSNGTLPYVPSLAGTGRLDQVLAEEGYHRVDTVRRDGRAVAIVAVNATGRGSGADPSVAIQSRLYVDADGVIRTVDHWERRPDGTVVEFRMDVVTGIDRVPIPWWAEDIGIYG